MSKYNVYTLRDLSAGEAGPLFIALTDEVAVRSACMMLKDSLYADDYLLVKVAVYDSSSMSITPIDPADSSSYDVIPFSAEFQAFRDKIAAYNRVHQSSLFDLKEGA